jgi:hypothetical protein
MGVDSSYIVQTNVSVKGVLFEALTYIEYIRERFCFSSLCTLRKAIKNFDVMLNQQRRALKAKEKVDNRCVSFI